MILLVVCCLFLCIHVCVYLFIYVIVHLFVYTCLHNDVMHQRSRGAPPMGAFERIDANGDGVVSREELGLRVYMYVYIYI